LFWKFGIDTCTLYVDMIYSEYFVVFIGFMYKYLLITEKQWSFIWVKYAKKSIYITFINYQVIVWNNKKIYTLYILKAQMGWLG